MVVITADSRSNPTTVPGATLEIRSIVIVPDSQPNIGQVTGHKEGNLDETSGPRCGDGRRAAGCGLGR